MSATRIVVLRPGALGDAILTLPVLQSLAAAGARVTAVGHPAFRLAVECGLAAESVAFDDPRLLGLFAEGGSCGLLAGCGLAIAYGPRPDPVLVASLARSGVARVVEWPAHPAPGTHIVDHLLGALGAAGLPASSRQPALPPVRSWLDAAQAWLQELGVERAFVAIHPGSGGRAKRWPLGRFAELAQRVERPAVWLLGPAEAEDAETHAVAERLGLVADALPLPALAGLLAVCEAYVGNDSGATHLAAAVGAPTLALFGPTDPAVWAPRGSRVAVLGGPAAGGFEHISLERVAAELRRLAPNRGERPPHVRSAGFSP